MQHAMLRLVVGLLLCVTTTTRNIYGMNPPQPPRISKRPPPIAATRRMTPVVATGDSSDADSHFASPRITSPRIVYGSATPGADLASWRVLRATWIALTNRGTRHVIDGTPLEDRYRIRHGLYVDTDLLCGVFDGHLGHRAAEIAAEKIPLVLHPHLIGKPLTPSHVENALCHSFLATEDAIQENDGGTTATVAYVWPNIKRKKLVISVANTGDSRTLICDMAGNILLETRDHKAIDPDERTRVTEAGGIVLGHRISGSLSLSRSLGDLEQKHEHCGRATGLIPLPETYSYTMGTPCFILQASDGLWDHETSDHAAATVAAALASGENRQALLEQATRELYHHACQDDAIAPRDDTTILLTLLEPNIN